jgi:hypothetical protein
MNTISHRIYISVLAMTVILVTAVLAINGSDYYLTPLHERHAHSQYDSLKPTGILGHGIGIAGSMLIITGVFGYMARKRFRSMSRLGLLKHWLEFHIFLCALGPILVLFHTSFKFGGIIAISFWSMTVVVISGIIGRYIYLQIPRSIEGRELTLNELNRMEADSGSFPGMGTGIPEEIPVLLNNGVRELMSINDRNHIVKLVKQNAYQRRLTNQVNRQLKNHGVSGKQARKVMRLFRSKITLARRISHLTTMQKLFRYWHVAHLPFAMTMFVIMLVHIAVAILFGYIWIF